MVAIFPMQRQVNRLVYIIKDVHAVRPNNKIFFISDYVLKKIRVGIGRETYFYFTSAQIWVVTGIKRFLSTSQNRNNNGSSEVIETFNMGCFS